MNLISQASRVLGMGLASGLLAIAGCSNQSSDPAAAPPPQSASSSYEESGGTEGTFGEPGAQEPQPAEENAPPGQQAPPPQGGDDMGGPQGNAGQAAPPPAENVTSDEVEEFAGIQLELMKVEQTFQQRAQSGEDIQTLQQELDETAAEVIEESSLSERRYLSIAQRVRGDAELRQEVESSMREQAGG